MRTPNLSEERLRSVVSLFTPSKIEGRQQLLLRLESVAVELGRLGSMDPFPLKAISADRARQLVTATFYASTRLNDFLLRQSFIAWLRRQFIEHSQYPSGLWPAFGALAIKDFHADISSLMDATAPLAILIDTEIKKDDLDKLPGFADIQRGTKRSYRTRMQPDLLEVVDATEQWWPFVKHVRDVALHRKHQRLVFGSAQNGLLFQIFEPSDIPVVTEPVLAGPGTDIADFLLYSAWVTAELLHFLDRISHVLAARLSFASDVLDSGGRVSSFTELLDSIDTLISRLNVQPGRA
jgi:hypothetical protein